MFRTARPASLGSAGVPTKGVTLKLVPNDGKWEARMNRQMVTPGYWRDPGLTADVFDAEGVCQIGDALRFADPDDAAAGYFFDGRTAETFKMSTGTWVSVGALRARLGGALGGLARDAAIVGEGRDELGALLVPFRPVCAVLVPGGSAMSDDEQYGHETLRAEIAARLAADNATAAR